MPGTQISVGIDTVNAVPADFKYGPYANTAAAISAIPLALRYDGMTVQITGSGNYWWIAADLSDLGLVAKGGGTGGASLAIASYVYLVGTAGDQTRMGGASSNVYITLQAAYNAAVALGVRTVIQVGNVTAAQVGNLVLTANWNTNVILIGQSRSTSVIGTISGDYTANIAAFNITIGTITTSKSITLSGSNSTFGNITCIAATGNSGVITIDSNNSIFGNITQSANTGIVNTLSNNGFNNSFQTILREQTNLSAAYNISGFSSINQSSIVSYNSKLYFAAGTGATNISLGNISIYNSSIGSIIIDYSYTNSISLVRINNLTLNNCVVGSINILGNTLIEANIINTIYSSFALKLLSTAGLTSNILFSYINNLSGSTTFDISLPSYIITFNNSQIRLNGSIGHDFYCENSKINLDNAFDSLTYNVFSINSHIVFFLEETSTIGGTCTLSYLEQLSSLLANSITKNQCFTD